MREPVAEQPGWTELFDGSSLEGWSATEFGGEGEVAVEDGCLWLPMGSPLTGVHVAEDVDLPTTDYELEVVAARVLGTDFFCGLTFPVGESHATLVLGGWGGTLTGISCIDGHDASENETRSLRRFEDGVDYRARVRVTPERILAWLDDEQLLDLPIAGRRVEVRTEVLPSRPLGIASFITRARVRSVRIRPLAGERAVAAPRP